MAHEAIDPQVRALATILDYSYTRDIVAFEALCRALEVELDHIDALVEAMRLVDDATLGIAAYRDVTEALFRLRKATNTLSIEVLQTRLNPCGVDDVTLWKIHRRAQEGEADAVNLGDGSFVYPSPQEGEA